jgi:probable rRNA maturation factor
VHDVFASCEIPEGEPGADVDVDRWADLAVAALDREHRGSGELNLMFVDALDMAELNRAHMGSDGPTDVLAFPIDGETQVGDGVPALLGDVVICPAVAAENATERGCPLDDELALLVVHGVLHVLGHDHQDEPEAELMRSKEQALLAAHHRR